MPTTRSLTHKPPNYARNRFLATNDLRHSTLTFPPLKDLITYGQVSAFSRAEVMAMIRARGMRYTCPFFPSAESSNHFFHHLDDRRAWIVGSVALAAISFSCDPPTPDNLNVISSYLTEHIWVRFMCDVLRFNVIFNERCAGYYGNLGSPFMVLVHPDVPAS